jgi:uncharacterized membrane protein
MCDRAYPKKLAFQYLEDLKNEFERVNGSQIETAARPYAFIKFGGSHFFLHGPFYVLHIFTALFLVLLLMCLSFPFLFMFKRHIHTENEEAVSGHSYSAEYFKVE